MQFKAHCNPTLSERRLLTKTFRVMKVTVILLLAACLQVSARGYSQSITLSLKNAPLEKVFQEVQKQTRYSFIYTRELLEHANGVNLEVKDASLEQVLERCFKDQPLTYTIDKNFIIVKPKPATTALQPLDNAPVPQNGQDIHGRVIDSTGAPLSGATVTMRGTRRVTSTNEKGEYELKGLPDDAVLVISHVGYYPREIKLTGKEREFYAVVLKHNDSPLDQVQVIAYGTTSPRLSTGNVTTVTSADIEKQPVANPLLALEGRVPGLFITQQSGVPGAGVTVQIQGQNSIANGSDPLYVIDGVPYPSELLPDASMGFILNYSGNNGSPAGPGSPLSYINPGDIESISVLKDADATSIYGSRAANGAILITTKKGVAGPTKVDISAQSGYGEVSRGIKMLNTTQYLEMRREAISNDDLTVGPDDFDINGVWDTTRNTNWQKALLGGTAQYTNVNMTVSGGSATTQFLVGGTFNRQTTVFPGDFSDQKGAVHFSVNNVSANQKFKVQLTGSYMIDDNHLPSVDLTNIAVRYAPDAPALYNKDGSLNWGLDSSVAYLVQANPLVYTLNTYSNKTNNMVSNALLSYQLFRGLTIKSSFGYTNLQTAETQFNPLIAVMPSVAAHAERSAVYGNNDINSWIIEPQANFRHALGKGMLDVLAGSTIEQQNSSGYQVAGTGYNSDAVLGTITAASQLYPYGSTYAVYKYNAAFGRINYNWSDKYIINLNVRRDGTSRFGSENQFHDFASAAGAWIFSQENFFKNNFPSLSFGKLRVSYGTTGNDQVGDYTFMTLYAPTTNQGLPYQGQVGLQPTGLSNPYLQWELTRKSQFGVDLGFLKDRILFSANYAINRSSNQLLNYTLPAITGFTSVEANLPAKVQNTSWELTLNTRNVQTKNFRWSSSFNLTIPRNKLLAYPGLATSSYSSIYKIGQPLNIAHVYHLLGVNDTTGIYQFASSQGPTYNPSYGVDNNVIIKLDPKYYGGFQNTFSYKGIDLSFLLQFTKKLGPNLALGGASDPGVFQGGANNQPTYVLNRWQKPGDIKPIQKFNSDYSIGNEQSLAGGESDAAFTDASFVRLKNLSLSWQLPASWKKAAHLQNARLYVQGQNLLTVTRFKGMDPESPNNASALPPLRILTVGVQVAL
jgi:TonB-dependent starch-binding outer membrane protein SusC